jgi:perosamine synthetase
MTNIQAALGVAQLERIDDFAVRKRKIGLQYNELLSDVECIELPAKNTGYADNIYWVYGVVLNDDIGFDATEAMARLKEKKIGTRPFFWPMHEQPVFNKMGLFENETHPVAQRLARRGFYIPSGLTLTDETIEHVTVLLKEVLR